MKYAIIESGGKQYKAVEGGTIEVSVAPSGDDILLVVSDTGPGIPEGSFDQIFDRFSRVDDAHSAEGTGLGLSIVRAIARAHGGNVTAANSEGGGAVFRVSLPRGA